MIFKNNDNKNSSVEFPYGKYPTNLLKLFEKSYENREGKESYYIVSPGVRI